MWPGTGAIVNTRGEVMGTHAGIHHYTIGQRRGIGVADAQPLYVLGIDSLKNRVVVGHQEELLSDKFITAGLFPVFFIMLGIFFMKILMILFCWVKGSCRKNFRYNWFFEDSAAGHFLF